MKVLRVAAESNPIRVADLIVDAFKETEDVHLQAIGAMAVYKAIKATIAANLQFHPEGILCMTTEYVDVTVEGNVRTAIRFGLPRSAASSEAAD